MNKEHYMKNMADNLAMLRAKAGLKQEDLCQLIGVSRQTIVSAEKTGKLSWNTYLSLVFLFSQNSEIQTILEFLDIYPKEFKSLFDKNISLDEEIR